MSAPPIRDRLIEIAAQLLDDEGAAALSTRRLAKEAGVSTMAVYTHFGSMGELFKAVAEEAFDRFAHALSEPATTDDPLRDLGELAAAYRAFAVANPHLYAVMFGGTFGSWRVSGSEIANAPATYQVLVDAVTRVIASGTFRPADPLEVAYQLWAVLHGFVQLELTGSLQRTHLADPEQAWRNLLLNTAKGFMP